MSQQHTTSLTGDVFPVILKRNLIHSGTNWWFIVPKRLHVRKEFQPGKFWQFIVHPQTRQISCRPHVPALDQDTQKQRPRFPRGHYIVPVQETRMKTQIQRKIHISIDLVREYGLSGATTMIEWIVLEGAVYGEITVPS